MYEPVLIFKFNQSPSWLNFSTRADCRFTIFPFTDNCAFSTFAPSNNTPLYLNSTTSPISSDTMVIC